MFATVLEVDSSLNKDSEREEHKQLDCSVSSSLSLSLPPPPLLLSFPLSLIETQRETTEQ